jgi:hypothetical protein
MDVWMVFSVLVLIGKKNLSIGKKNSFILIGKKNLSIGKKILFNWQKNLFSFINPSGLSFAAAWLVYRRLFGDTDDDGTQQSVVKTTAGASAGKTTTKKVDDDNKETAEQSTSRQQSLPEEEEEQKADAQMSDVEEDVQVQVMSDVKVKVAKNLNSSSSKKPSTGGQIRPPSKSTTVEQQKEKQTKAVVATGKSFALAVRSNSKSVDKDEVFL